MEDEDLKEIKKNALADIDEEEFNDDDNNYEEDEDY